MKKIAKKSYRYTILWTTVILAVLWVIELVATAGNLSEWRAMTVILAVYTGIVFLAVVLDGILRLLARRKK